MRIRSTSSLLILAALAAPSCSSDSLDEATLDDPESTTEQAVCTYPMIAQFGTNDAFDPMIPDPIPYGAPAYVLPEFDTYLTSIGVPQAVRKTFDSLTSNRHMVATLRHGLRGCFAGATSLQLCFRARGHSDIPGNDTVSIYNTDFGVYSFPVVYSSFIAPTLTPTWTPTSSATLCINLTAQMTGGFIGDMLQFRTQDDTGVDSIRMILN